MKVVGTLTYQLGRNYFCDKEKIVFWPKKYIAKVMEQLKYMFVHKPKDSMSLFEKYNRPDIDYLEVLELSNT
jgi:hypothetical protein